MKQSAESALTKHLSKSLNRENMWIHCASKFASIALTKRRNRNSRLTRLAYFNESDHPNEQKTKNLCAFPLDRHRAHRSRYARLKEKFEYFKHRKEHRPLVTMTPKRPVAQIFTCVSNDSIQGSVSTAST